MILGWDWDWLILIQSPRPAKLILIHLGWDCVLHSTIYYAFKFMTCQPFVFSWSCVLLKDHMLIFRCIDILVSEYMNFRRNSSAHLNEFFSMFSCVLTVHFLILQVYIFIYWSRRGSLCYLLFWLYRSCNTEFMLLELCILITLMFFKVAMVMSHRYHVASWQQFNLVVHK